MIRPVGIIRLAAAGAATAVLWLSPAVAADKAYDTRDFVQTMRAMQVTPHVSQNLKRSGEPRMSPAKQCR